MIPLNMYENSIGWRSLENEINLHLLTLNSNAFASHHSATLVKKNQVLDYFLQYMFSKKLQRYYFTVIVSQNIAFVLLIKKKSGKYIKKNHKLQLKDYFVVLSHKVQHKYYLIPQMIT
jgi:hypothetical protein